MKAIFYPLTVASVDRETDQAVAITFDVPEELRETFRFTQGQHLTLRTEVEGQEVRRNYSLCSSPLDGQWRIGVKQVPGGLFSSYANGKLKPGDTVEVMPPMGRFFTPLDPQQSKHYLAVAAGSGITPILSLIRTTLAVEPQSRFTLVYGNQRRGTIMFREELEALKNKYMDRFRLYHVLSREKTDADIYHGRIDAAKCDLLFSRLIDPADIQECFLCGPQEMIETVRDYLQQRGVPAGNIHFELFAAAGQSRQPKHPDAARIAAQPKSHIVIRLDGVESGFDLGYEDVSILDAALAHGAELPYACKGGVCCTCKAKLVEGEVDMEVNYGLEPDEVAAGFVLTCQSHPKTPRVVVDFDARH